MGLPHEERRAGLASVEASTALLQRVRNAHPTKGLYEAAELEFWWSSQRSTDSFEQLFWFDDQGQPEAAVLVNDFGEKVSLVYTEPTVVVCYLPDSTPEWIAHVVDRGLAHLKAGGIDSIEIETDRADDVMATILSERGFELHGDAVVEAWLDADAIPEVSELHEGYQLLNRGDSAGRPHHMNRADGVDRAARLLEVSLYRPELDLFVVDDQGEVAGYGLFWYDPVSETGVVEPMRTHEEHRQKGLARHILTAGVNLLAQAGAKRISIGWEPENPASGHAYESVGFQAHRRTDMWGGPTAL